MDFDTDLFARLCEQDRISNVGGESIGTYNEKRLHRIIKDYITSDKSAHEVKVGNYIADVLCENKIFEIQTGPFRTLSPKIKYYLDNTDYSVCVIRPIIVEKMLIRADRETGEVYRKKRSPKHEGELDAAVEMYSLAWAVGHPRFELCIMQIKAEEYRFSEAVRYRKKGKYDNDLFPVELLNITTYKSTEDYLSMVPKPLTEAEFSASEFSEYTKLGGRKLYSVLNLLCNIGVLDKISDGKRNKYFLKRY